MAVGPLPVPERALSEVAYERFRATLHDPDPGLLAAEMARGWSSHTVTVYPQRAVVAEPTWLAGKLGAHRVVYDRPAIVLRAHRLLLVDLMVELKGRLGWLILAGRGATIRAALERAGFEVIEARSRQEAIDQAGALWEHHDKRGKGA